MRPFEWTIALVVAAIVWQWVRGRRAAFGLGAAGAVLVAASVLLEGQRAAMWPAYVIVLVALALALRRPVAPPVRAGVIKRGLRTLGALVALLLGVGLPWLWPVLKLPTPTGPHPIGTAWLVVRDSTRRERFSAKPGAVREFPVKIWYPASAGATGRMAEYAAPEAVSTVAPLLLARQMRLVRTHAIVGAPMAEGRAPVVIFSHGYGGYAEQNTPQMEELASRGYLVASIAHPGEAGWAPFPDGRGVRFDTGLTNAARRRLAKEGGKAPDPARLMDSLSRELAVPDRTERLANFRKFLDLSPEPLRSESVNEWALDTKALVDLLGDLYAGHLKSPFMGKLDLEHLGVFGMSYGGATAGEFCRRDHRCRAAINIDGGQYGGLIDDSLRVPLLILGSEQAIAVHGPVLDLARGPAFLARVPATTHMGLSDATLLSPVLFRWTGFTGKLDPDRREAIMSDFIVGFFEKYLMQRSPELFDGLAKKYPDVTLTTRNVP